MSNTPLPPSPALPVPPASATPAAAPAGLPVAGGASGVVGAPRVRTPAAAPAFSPLYRQIKQAIMQGLEQGDWKPGDLIPSETELASRFGVSQGTVRKAIDELAGENHLVRRQGKGTFVATHHEPKAQFRFLRLMPDDGDPYHPENHILDCRRTRAPSEIARMLEIKAGETVVVIRRVLRFHGTPKVYDEIWLPGGAFKGLTHERLAEYHASMYALFETEFGIRMIHADERLRAVAAEGAVAEILGMPTGSPLLHVERVSYTYGARPVEVRRGHYVTTEHHYFNELS